MADLSNLSDLSNRQLIRNLTRQPVGMQAPPIPTRAGGIATASPNRVASPSRARVSPIDDDNESQQSGSTFRPISPPHATLVGSKSTVKPEPKQNDAYYEDLDVDSLCLHVYDHFNIRILADDAFNTAIHGLIRERYDVTLTELDSTEGTEHMSALAHVAIDTSAKVLTEIIEEKFIPTLQDHISICFQCALANQQIDIRKEANQPARPVHLLQLDDILSQLTAHANELDTTAQTIRKLDTAKLEAATKLRSLVNDMELDTAATADGDDSENSTSVSRLQGKIAEYDKKLATFNQYTGTVREAIRALLHKSFNTPDTDWDKEQKSLKTLKLDIKLAGKADPKLVEDLMVSIRTVLHGSVSRFWAIIPFFETMDADREHTEFWNFPCEANDYMGVPQSLRKRYISQSRLLFMHMWSSSSGSTQVGSTIMRKTYGRKFLGDAIGEGDSVKSSQNDGMASLYFLVATHEYAGYEERSRLRSTLHTTHSLFATGNPQSKLPAVRLVLDKAMSLKVKIDYNATVKPIVSILRKRSPNFNELATKYLGSESVKYYAEGWEENGLHIFDTLLSEIDHVIDVLGMTGVQELNDAKSKALAADARNVFAYYTTTPSDGNTRQSVSGDNDGAGNGPKPEGGFGCNKKCAVKDCDNPITGETRDKVNAYRIRRLEQLKAEGKTPKFQPAICQSCSEKLIQGHVQSLSGTVKGMKFISYEDKKGYKRVTLEKRQSANSTRETGNKKRNNKQEHDGGNDNAPPSATMNADTSVTDVTTLVRSTILDMFVPKPETVENVTPAPAPVNDPEQVRLNDFRAQMARLGIGNDSK